MSLTYELGQFVEKTSFNDIPKETIEAQKKSVLDNIGNILGASGIGEGCKAAVKTAEQLSAGGEGEATVIGFNEKLPVAWAAFANASMSHSLDFGDSYSGKGVALHPNASTFPAALSVAEKLDVDGKTFLTALVLGSEMACRVGMANRHKMDSDGFYPPVIVTSYGATTSVAKLLGLDAKQFCNAISFNLCQATCSSELINNKETDVRSIRESFAAKSAVVSGYMAKNGLKGFEQPLEGKYGFFHAYSRGEAIPEKMLEDLGTVYHAGEIVFKPWPSCLGTHTAIDASIELATKYDIRPEEVERVHLKVSQGNVVLVEPPEVKKAPESGIIAKFSDFYASAIGITNRSCSLKDYSEEAFHDQKLRELMSKYTYEIMDEWDRNSGKGLWTDVTIYTKRGEFHELKEVPYGAASRPMPYSEICNKMRNNASVALNPPTSARLDQIQDTIEHLDELDSIRDLTKLL